jgi:adenylate cyclase
MVEEVQLAILFADVVGSTKLYETLGDSKARSCVGKCVEVMSQITEQYNGKVVKTIGDEVMSTFPSADAATEAACEMQNAITEDMIVDGVDVAIRVGYHFGPALFEKGDVFGDAVNTAARMAGQSKSGQILTTSTTVQFMSAVWQSTVRQIDKATVKGKASEIEMIEVIWKEEDVTRMAGTAVGLAQQPEFRKLMVSYQGIELEMGDARPSVIMGRSDGSDLTVKHTLVSRLHSRIEYRKGKFILIDQSINGTYVVQEDGSKHFVKRDEFALSGNGTIGLGQAVTPEHPQAIVFNVV